jgi:hypothetical protein
MEDKEFFAVLDAYDKTYCNSLCRAFKINFGQIFHFLFWAPKDVINNKKAEFKKNGKKFNLNLNNLNAADLRFHMALELHFRFRESESKRMGLISNRKHYEGEREKIIKSYKTYLETEFMKGKLNSYTYLGRIYELEIEKLNQQLAEKNLSREGFENQIKEKNHDKALIGYLKKKLEMTEKECQDLDLKLKEFIKKYVKTEKEYQDFRLSVKEFMKKHEIPLMKYVSACDAISEVNDGHLSQSQSKSDAPDQKLNETEEPEQTPQMGFVLKMVESIEEKLRKQSRESNNTVKKNFTKRPSRGIKM